MSSIDNIPELLKQVPKQVVNSSPSSENTYNIFKVMGVEYNEVILCRFIGSLLDPDGGHELGDKPLWHFICDVLRDEILEENLINAKINLEEHTYNGRRIDIVIHLPNKVYPIEVKIWGSDQNKQLDDYYNNFFDKSGKDKIYYLTPSGRLPSEESRGDLQNEQITCISFSEDIINWLNTIKDKASENIKFVIMNRDEQNTKK